MDVSLPASMAVSRLIKPSFIHSFIQHEGCCEESKKQEALSRGASPLGGPYSTSAAIIPMSLRLSGEKGEKEVRRSSSLSWSVSIHNRSVRNKPSRFSSVK